jgi:hypothetical protein
MAASQHSNFEHEHSQPALALGSTVCVSDCEGVADELGLRVLVGDDESEGVAVRLDVDEAENVSEALARTVPEVMIYEFDGEGDGVTINELE